MDTRKRILIVDDDSENQLFIQAFLESLGYEIEIATSVKEGIEKIQAKLPHLILLDYMMPGEVGSELVKYVRQQDGFCHIPIVMLTAYTLMGSIDASLKDVNAVAHKPIDNLEIFSALIQQLLSVPG